MGDDNKLTANIGGKPMIAFILDALHQSGISQTYVVTGHDAEGVKKALLNQNIKYIKNNHYNNGLSTSIKAGIDALSDDIDGVMICLGDMPLVSTDDIKALVAAFTPDDGKSICVPVHERQQGNPVLWGRQHFATLAALDGDRGAKALLDQFADAVIEVDASASVLRDVDHAAALAAIRREMKT